MDAEYVLAGNFNDGSRLCACVCGRGTVFDYFVGKGNLQFEQGKSQLLTS